MYVPPSNLKQKTRCEANAQTSYLGYKIEGGGGGGGGWGVF